MKKYKEYTEEEKPRGHLDEKLKRQRIGLVIILFIAFVAAVAGSISVARQQSDVPWASNTETMRATQVTTTSETTATTKQAGAWIAQTIQTQNAG